MNNDIKEILTDLEWRAKSNDIWYFMEQEKCKLLYDYITNLQEENKILRGNTDLVNLELIELTNELEDKIDKAIEYIKEMCWIDKEYGYCNYGDDLRPEHIVSILEGDDKDDNR